MTKRVEQAGPQDEYMSTADYSGATGTFMVRAEIDGDVASVLVGLGGEVLPFMGGK